MDDYLTVPPGVPEPTDDGAAAHLPGRRLPELSLVGTDGNAVTLSALGTGRTVVYLYPLTGRPGIALPEHWDSIPGARGCTPEACGFRDHFHELLEAGAERVYGLSSQDSAYQYEAVQRLHLPFEMLSDPELNLARSLALPTFTVDGRTLLRRLTLVIRDGVVEHVFYPIFPPDGHAEQVLTWLRKHPIDH